MKPGRLQLALPRSVSFWTAAALAFLAAASNAAASPLYQVYQGQFRFPATTLTLVLTVYVAASGPLGWWSLTETPPGNVIADAIHSRMFCAPRLTNAYHFQ